MNNFFSKKKLKDNRGITLLTAVLTAGLLLTVSLSIFNIAMKELIISSSGRDSHIAFYAADAGAECALYWEYRGAFSSSTTSTIRCAGNNFTVGAGTDNTFTIRDSAPGGACVHVEVTKTALETQIESRGYNTCDDSSRRTERAIRVKY